MMFMLGAIVGGVFGIIIGVVLGSISEHLYNNPTPPDAETKRRIERTQDYFNNPIVEHMKK